MRQDRLAVSLAGQNSCSAAARIRKPKWPGLSAAYSSKTYGMANRRAIGGI